MTKGGFNVRVNLKYISHHQPLYDETFLVTMDLHDLEFHIKNIKKILTETLRVKTSLIFISVTNILP